MLRDLLCTFSALRFVILYAFMTNMLVFNGLVLETFSGYFLKREISVFCQSFHIGIRRRACPLLCILPGRRSRLSVHESKVRILLEVI